VSAARISTCNAQLGKKGYLDFFGNFLSMTLRHPSAVKTRLWAISWSDLMALGSGGASGSGFFAGLTGAAAPLSGLAGLGGGDSGFFFLKKIMSRKIPFIENLCQVLIPFGS
jgi:hypothetical protein